MNKKSTYKTFSLVLLICLVSFGSMKAQVIDQATLTTQAEVDNFHTDEVGDLVIEEASPGAIQNLDSLSGIGYIRTLTIMNNSAIKNLGGLRDANEILEITISGNASLTSIEFLELRITGTPVRCLISDNDALAEVKFPLWISPDQVVPGFIFFQLINNKSLTTLQLDSISRGGELIVEDSPIFENLIVPSLDELTGGLRLVRTGLKNLDALVNLTNIGQFNPNPLGIHIIDNDLLTNIDGLSNVFTTAPISIEDNNSLVNIDGLAGIRVVGEHRTFDADLNIINNCSLRDINGLSNLSNVLGNINISKNASLTNVDGLASLFEILFNLIISENHALADIDGLKSLRTLADLTIDKNNFLNSVNGLYNLAEARNIAITNNASLTEFCGLYNILSPPQDESHGVENHPITISGNASNPTEQEILDNGPCASPHSVPYMTIWTASNSSHGEKAELKFYSLSEGKQFENSEGEIIGYDGKKNIVDLAIDHSGNIYFLNNSFASILYKIGLDQVDLNSSSPLRAKQIGRLRTTDGKEISMSYIKIINNQLYGLNNTANKLYRINPINAVVTELVVISSLDSKVSGFTAGSDGNVYILKNNSQGKNEIWKFDEFPSGKLSFIFEINTGSILKSITAHPGGNLFTADQNYLYEIRLDEKLVGVLPDHNVEISGMEFNFRIEQEAEPGSILAFQPVSGITGIAETSTMPTEFKLEQNYPNPFNPSTTINYSIPVDVFITIKIYDALGNEVAVLVNEQKAQGRHQVNFDAANFASGVYYYSIKAGAFTEVRKMMMLK